MATPPILTQLPSFLFFYPSSARVSGTAFLLWIIYYRSGSLCREFSEITLSKFSAWKVFLLRLQCRILEVSAAQSVHFCESAGSAGSGREWEGKEGNPRK